MYLCVAVTVPQRGRCHWHIVRHSVLKTVGRFLGLQAVPCRALTTVTFSWSSSRAAERNAQPLVDDALITALGVRDNGKA